jgi:protein involved in polysaccharide export with SLBB domain
MNIFAVPPVRWLSCAWLACLLVAMPAWALEDMPAAAEMQKGMAAGAVEQTTRQSPPITPPSRPPLDAEGIQPFGANLFTGNFLKTREDGLNPNYVVSRGDQVAVYAWGSVEINELFTVDAQGNIFLPGIGPVRLEGVRNADLSRVVREKIRDVYINNFNVYTNLVTSQPVLVYVTGFVRHPGRYAGLPNDTLLYYLDLAGGIDTDLGSYRRIEIVRDGRSIAKVDLYDFLLDGTIPRVALRDGDTVLVKKRGPVIELDGDVARPTQIELTPAARLGKDLLSVVPQAAGAVEVSMIGYRNGRPFNQTLSISDFESARLADGDRVVLSAAGLSPTILVKIEGEHLGPPVLSVRRGARLVDVLNYVQVDPQLADVTSVHLFRPSVARAQKDSINDSLVRLERDSLLALSDSRGEAEIRATEAELVQKFVERAKLIEPLGRVVTVRDGEQQNIPLEPDDTIVIPRKTDVVRISGQVMMAQAVVYRPGFTVADYLAMAGGYATRADEDRVLLLRPDASVGITELDARVNRGDEILVLPKADTKWVQMGIDIMDVIYKIAISAKVALDL